LCATSHVHTRPSATSGAITDGGGGRRGCHAGWTIGRLNASGRAGSGADPIALRAAGHEAMPFKGDISTVTVPGCVDGWSALHDRFGTLPVDVLIAPARRLAADGFPASPLLVASLGRLDPASRANLDELAEQATRTGARVRRPGVALALASFAIGGRDAFYRGAFGDGLALLGDGLFSDADLAASQADWTTPLSATAFGVELHTIGPNSQGYLTIGGCRLADRLDLPDDPDDALWAHLLVEAASAAGFDRPDVLHDAADGRALLDAIDARIGMVDPDRASARGVPVVDGDTTYLCTAGRSRDGARMAVSLIQSNASGFGSHLFEPTTGINLHNRGMGFSLEADHPAELAPRRRPPHTLSPALATRDGRFVATFGTMGGDAQPQILLQLAARLFHHAHSPAAAVHAGRWTLHGPQSGFDTWTAPDGPAVSIEGHAPDAWRTGLAQRGHVVHNGPAYDSGYGHAHAIVIDPSGMLVGAADPRARVSAVAAI
jgi:gamma-glutamyltranspeptidase/glutathione hydrolase